MTFALSQLRHLYANLFNNKVKDQRNVACNLLSPAISLLERDYTPNTAFLNAVLKLLELPLNTPPHQAFSYVKSLKSFRDNHLRHKFNLLKGKK